MVNTLTYAAPGASLLLTSEIGASNSSLSAEAPFIQIPERWGRVDEVYQAPASVSQVIHISDAHGNVQAQLNIHRILTYLSRKGFKLLFLEGASEKMDPRLFPFSQNAGLQRDAAKHLMRAGEFSGAEFFLLSHAKKTQAFGVEDIDEYRRDIELFREVLQQKARATAFLQSLESELHHLEDRFLTKNLRELIREWRRFKDDQPSLLRFVAALERIASKVDPSFDFTDPSHQDQFPNLLRIHNLSQLEKKLVLTSANEEKQRLSARLRGIKTVSPAVIKSLEKIEEVKWPRFLLEKIAEQAGSSVDFRTVPAFTLYAQFLVLRSEIDGVALHQEAERLSETLMQRLARSEQERTLVRLILDSGLLAKLFALELSRAEWLRIQKNVSRFLPSNLEAEISRINPSAVSLSEQADKVAGLFNRALNFYQLAIERENYFLDHAFARMKEEVSERAVIVTGGFHALGLKDRLKEEGISYAAITPRIDQVGRSREIYLRSMLGPEQSQISNVLALMPLTLQQEMGAHLDQKLPLLMKALFAAGLERGLHPDDMLRELASQDFVTRNRLTFERNGGEIEISMDGARVAQWSLPEETPRKLIALASSLGEERPLRDSKGWFFLDEIVAFGGLLKDIVDPGKSSSYADYFRSPKKLLHDMREKLFVENQSKAARIDTTIQSQAPYKKQAVIELIANAIDAMMPSFRVIGRFGVGFYQVLTELEDPKDEVIVETSPGDGFTYRLRFRRREGRTVIKFQKIKSNTMGSGTRIRVVKNKKWTTEKIKEFEDFIQEKMGLNTAMPIIVNDKVINPLSNLKYLNGDDLTYFLPQASAVVKVDENGYEVLDHGIGMAPLAVFEQLLLTRAGGKGIPKKKLTPDWVKSSTKVFFQDDGKPEEEGIMNFGFQVSGVNIERFQIAGLNLPKRFYLELPPNTWLPESRNRITYDEVTYEAMKAAIDKVITMTTGDAQIRLINALAAAIDRLESKEKEIQGKTPLMKYLFDKVAKLKNESYQGAVFIPTKIDFLKLDLPAGAILLDPRVFDFKPAAVPGVEVPDQYVPESAMVYIVPFKTNDFAFESEGRIFINKKFYEKYKNDPLMLNLWINLWHDYGIRPRNKGRFVYPAFVKEPRKKEEVDTGEPRQGEKQGADLKPAQKKASRGEVEELTERIEEILNDIPDDSVRSFLAEMILFLSGLTPDLAQLVEKIGHLKDRMTLMQEAVGMRWDDTVLSVIIDGVLEPFEKDEAMKKWLSDNPAILQWFPLQSLRTLWNQFGGLMSSGNVTDILKGETGTFYKIRMDDDIYVLVNERGEALFGGPLARIFVARPKEKGGQLRFYLFDFNGDAFLGTESGDTFRINPNDFDFDEIVRDGGPEGLDPTGKPVWDQWPEESEDLDQLAGLQGMLSSMFSKMMGMDVSMGIPQRTIEEPDGTYTVYMSPRALPMKARRDKNQLIPINEGERVVERVLRVQVAGKDYDFLKYGEAGEDGTYALVPAQDGQPREPKEDELLTPPLAGVRRVLIWEGRKMYFLGKESGKGWTVYDETGKPAFGLEPRGFSSMHLYFENDKLTLMGHVPNEQDQVLYVIDLATGRTVHRLLNDFGHNDISITEAFTTSAPKTYLPDVIAKTTEEKIHAWLQNNYFYLTANTGTSRSWRTRLSGNFLTLSFSEYGEDSGRILEILPFASQRLLRRTKPALLLKIADFVKDRDWSDRSVFINFLNNAFLYVRSEEDWERVVERWMQLYGRNEVRAKRFAALMKGKNLFRYLGVNEKLDNVAFGISGFIKYLRQGTSLLTTDAPKRPTGKLVSEIRDLALSKLVWAARNKVDRTALTDLNLEKLKEVLAQIATSNSTRIDEEIQSAIEGMDKNEQLWIRELIQNARDEIRRKGAEKRIDLTSHLSQDGKFWDVTVRDPVGMSLFTIVNLLLNPEATDKDREKTLTGLFGQGFYTVFADFDEIHVVTGLGKGTYYEFSFVRDAAGKIVFNYLREFEGDFKGTEITRRKRTVNDQNEPLIDPDIESTFLQEDAMKYVGKIDDVDIALKTGGRETLLRSHYDLKSKGEVGSKETGPLGEVKIYGNKDGIQTLMQDGLFVRDIWDANDEIFDLVPGYIKELLALGAIGIELPKDVPLTRTRNEMSQKETYLPLIQKAVALAAMRFAIKMFFQEGSPIPNLPHDYLQNYTGSYERQNMSAYKDWGNMINSDDLSFDVKSWKEMVSDPEKLMKTLLFVQLEQSNGTKISLQDLRQRFLRLLERAEDAEKLEPTEIVNTLSQDLDDPAGLLRHMILSAPHFIEGRDRERDKKPDIQSLFPRDMNIRPEDSPSLKLFIRFNELIYELMGKPKYNVSYYWGENRARMANYGNSYIDWNFWHPPSDLENSNDVTPRLLVQILRYIMESDEPLDIAVGRFEAPIRNFLQVMVHEYAHLLEKSDHERYTHGDHFLKIMRGVVEELINKPTLMLEIMEKLKKEFQGAKFDDLEKWIAENMAEKPPQANSLGKADADILQYFQTQGRDPASVLRIALARSEGGIMDGVLYFPGSEKTLRWAMRELGLIENGMDQKKPVSAGIRDFNQGGMEAFLSKFLELPARSGSPMPLVVFEDLLQAKPDHTVAIARGIADALAEGDLLVAVYESEEKPRVISELYRLAHERRIQIRSVRQALAAVQIPGLIKNYSSQPLTVSSLEEGAFAVKIRGQKVVFNLNELKESQLDPVQVLALLRQIGDDPEAFRKLGFIFDQNNGYWVVGSRFAQMIELLYTQKQAEMALKQAA